MSRLHDDHEGEREIARELLAQGRRSDPRPSWRAATGWLRGALVDNAALKFVALVLSLTVFILVHSDEEAVAGASVNVYYTMPTDQVLVSERVDQLRVTVKGSRRRIKRFDSDDLEPIHIDLAASKGGELFFQPNMIDLPEGIELVSITPASMMVRFEERAERTVPVVVETSGTLPRGYRVAHIAVEPSTMTVAGARSAVNQVVAVRTQLVSLDGQRGEVVQDVPLTPMEGVELSGPEQVRVSITLGEEQGTREVGPLAVTVRPAGLAPEVASRLRTEPAEVRVVLRGTVLSLDKVDPSTLSAYIRPAASDLAGGRPIEVRISPALPGIGFEVQPPEVVVKPVDAP